MNIGCELLSLVRSGSQRYGNSNSQSPARFIINSLSATISNPALCGATPVTTNSYISMPTRPSFFFSFFFCTGYYSHGLYVAFLTRFDHTFLTTCKYWNQIKAAYLFPLSLVFTSNLLLSSLVSTHSSTWCDWLFEPTSFACHKLDYFIVLPVLVYSSLVSCFSRI